MAARRASVKVSSSFPMASGSFSSHATKASWGMLGPPLLACLKKFSSDISFSLRCCRTIVLKVCTLVTIRNSSPPCSTRGAQASVAFLSSASMPARASLASISSFLPAYFCSCSLATFWCLPSSSVAAFMRACSFSNCSLKVVVPRFSLCLSARNTRAALILACTSLDTGISFSQAASASSAASCSVASAAKGLTASAIFFTCSSAASIRSLASCIRAVFFRLSVSLRNWPSFAAAALMRSVIAANSSTAGLEAASLYCFTSKFLEAMKVRAWLIAVCTTSAAVSDALMVSVASWRGSTSMPLRKGSSASFTFSMASWTSCVFCLPSLMYASAMTRSRASLVELRTPVSFSWAALHLSASFCRVAFKEGGLPGTWDSTFLVEALSVF
mmetsp:Transcript_84012/g.216273  ORF Transcript_84012/g.216273 Transcript_84012/m.216273 type:complete len:387 (+) Transcript_84012:2552-3712(+)